MGTSAWLLPRYSQQRRLTGYKRHRQRRTGGLDGLPVVLKNGYYFSHDSEVVFVPNSPWKLPVCPEAVLEDLRSGGVRTSQLASRIGD